MTHKYILCEDCDILWCINEYSQCPLCRLSKTFGKINIKNFKDKTESEISSEQTRIEELTKEVRNIKENE